MIDSTELLTPLDFISAPFVIILIYLIAFRIRNESYPKGHPWRSYFIPGLTIKLIGAIFIGLIYAYYYKGGDTFNFHFHARVINSAINESLGKWINLITSTASKEDIEYYNYTSQLYWYDTGGSYLVSAIDAIISAPLGSLYLPSSIVFSALSFSGLWAIFRTFSKIYPKLTQSIATACLYVPSLAIWGSGIFKDTISMLSLGWLTYSLFEILVSKNYLLRNFIILIFSIYLCANIKLYIIISIAPPLFYWVGRQRLKKVENSLKRKVLNFCMILLSGFILVLITENIQYADLNNIVEKSKITRNYIHGVSITQEGSAYSLGEFEPTLKGMLGKSLEAINVTLFRPYVWEINKLIPFLASLESLALLYITLKLVINIGFKNIIRTIIADSTIIYCLTFSIIFSFFVGISSYNFGALSRYKIPCIPFYIIALILIWYKNMPPKNKLFKLFKL